MPLVEKRGGFSRGDILLFDSPPPLVFPGPGNQTRGTKPNMSSSKRRSSRSLFGGSGDGDVGGGGDEEGGVGVGGFDGVVAEGVMLMSQKQPVLGGNGGCLSAGFNGFGNFGYHGDDVSDDDADPERDSQVMMYNNDDDNNNTQASNKRRRKVQPAVMPASRQHARLIEMSIWDQSFNRNIHLPGICKLIVDTPEFQRLRDLKQLGGCHYMHPSATHTRFEHSLGVAYLSLRLARSLQHNDVDNLFDITDTEVLCVGIAGLIHDLGHGPFSHAFEQFMSERNLPFCHEDMSVKLFRRIIDTAHGVRDALATEGIGEEDLVLIEMMVKGLKPEAPMPTSTGRGEAKRFLCEIVANSRHGIDTDKLDYLLRDGRHVQGGQTLMVQSITKRCRIVRGPGAPKGPLKDVIQAQIAWDWDVQRDLFDVFALRTRMHRAFYMNRTKRLSEQLIRDILVLADEHVLTRGEDGVGLGISLSTTDLVAYSNLTDSVLQRVASVPSANAHPNVAKAQALLERLHRREFYRNVNTLVPAFPYPDAVKRLNQAKVRDAIVKLGGGMFQASDIWVDVVRITMGGKRDPETGEYDNPLRYVLFTGSGQSPAQYIDPVRYAPSSTPISSEEIAVRVYCRVSDDDVVFAAMCDATSRWWKQLTASTPSGGGGSHKTMAVAETPPVKRVPSAPAC